MVVVIGNKRSTRYNLRTECILAVVVKMVVVVVVVVIGNKRSTRYNLRTECILAVVVNSQVVKITDLRTKGCHLIAIASSSR